MTLLDEAPPAAPEETPAPDPAAPYGYKADGVTPRKRPVSPNLRPFMRGNPGRPVGSGRGSRARGAASSAPRARTAGPRAPRGGRVDYAKPLRGLGQLLAFPLSFVPATRMDALAITAHWPAIADALDETAQNNVELAAVLDRVVKVGPYGALLTAVTPLLAQIAVNHGGPLQLLRSMGAISPQLLMARAMRDQAKDAAKTAGDAAAEEAEIRAIAAELGWTVEDQAAA